MSIALFRSRGPVWLVCETTGRWAAALRLAIARHEYEARPRLLPRRVREFRSLAELDAVLHQQGFAHSFEPVPKTSCRVGTAHHKMQSVGGRCPPDETSDRLLVEVHRENLGAVLGLLSSHRHNDMRVVALLAESMRHGSSGRSSTTGEQLTIIDALFEAGATDVLRTPRQIGPFLAATSHHDGASFCHGDVAREYSIAELAWNALPWQED